jgi:hypothetical protein
MMHWPALTEAFANLTQGALAPLAVLWTVFWPARHALLTVALILLYVHRLEPSSDEDPFTF